MLLLVDVVDEKGKATKSSLFNLNYIFYKEINKCQYKNVQ
jgi:hypothetical protein